MADRAGSIAKYKRMTKAQLIDELSELRSRIDSPHAAGAAEPAPRSQGRRESAEYFRAVFDGTNDAIFVIDPKLGQIFDANASACRMLRYDRPELLRLGIAEIHPHEMAWVEEFAREVFEHGDGRIDTLSCRTKFGDYIPVEMRASPIEMAGRSLLLVVVRDISERLQAEQTRREGDDQLRKVAEATPVPVVMTRKSDGIILYANPWFGLALGIPAEDAVGQTMRRFYADPEDRQILLKALEEKGHARNLEFRMRRPDGTVISTVLSIQSFEFQGEECLIGAFNDVTERRKAEAERRRAEERLRDAIESITDGFALFDADDRLVMWNRRLAEIYPELEAMLEGGPTAEEMFRARYQAGAVGEFDVPAEEYVAWRMEMRRKRGGTPSIHRHRDGRWFRTTERATREGGIVSVSTDITELKMAQARLIDAIESIGEGFAYFDGDDRLAFCNENYRNRWPAVRDHIVPGIGFIELAELLWDHGYIRGTHLDKEAWLTERMDQRSDSAAVVREISPGTWIQMNEDPIRDGGFVQIVTDISASVKAGAELRAARDQAEFASRTKTEFLANVSHELRTPLNAINGFSEIMVSEMFGPLGNPRYADYARDIYDSGTHLLSLINDILDLSKVEAGKLELDENEVDTAETVQACLRIVKQRANEGDVALVNKVGRGVPHLMADERALKQIIINLLSNAIKFTPPGGKVTVRAGIAGDGGFRISISDTGIGMAAEDIATALTPFAQVESSFSHKQDGTGLGLPLVKSLVELHGGTLEIVSEPGVGTNVHAWFPAARIIESEASPNQSAGAA